MRLEDLQVYSVLAETENLRRTADKVGMTQSAITKILRRLETEFDLALVERHARGVALTQAGRILLERAVILKSAIGDLRTEMSALKSAELGTVRLGTIPPRLETTLLPLFPRLLSPGSQIRFEISLQVSSMLIREVQRGDIDLALCLAPESIPEDLQSDKLGKLPFQVVGRSGHPLI